MYGVSTRYARYVMMPCSMLIRATEYVLRIMTLTSLSCRMKATRLQGPESTLPQAEQRCKTKTVRDDGHGILDS